jgi:beta-phosphoglucomutase
MHFPDIPPPSALFFDFDGVIAQSEETHISSWDLAARSICQLELPADLLNSFRGQATKSILKLICDFAGRALDSDLLLNTKRECLQKIASEVKIFPGARELLSILQNKGIPHAIVSNSRSEFINAVLASHGISGPPIIAADNVRAPKPAPEPYLRAAQTVKLDLQKYSAAWVFEDSYTGLRSAASASMKPFGIRTHFDEAYLKSAGALVTFADISEVLEALKRNKII